ncbi:MAG TPA: M2 family metallopeptidase, partial [Myxococcaceae bacterium]|nr:M2 family metallopeptidase [Myxococcaceae bacterium]
LLALVQSFAAAAAPPSTPDEGRAFVTKVNDDLRPLTVKQSTADWIKATYITEDTERGSAWANDALLAATRDALLEAKRFDGVALDPDTARMIRLLRVNNTVLAPANAAHRAELTEILAKMEGIYGAGKDCGPDGKGKCRDLEALEKVLDRSRDPKALLDAWLGWHAVGRQIRPLYERFVVLGNEGARDNGFGDLGALWKSAYDMTPEEFEKENDRIWAQLEPLYDDLHCYVRAALQKKYGKTLVPDGKPIPAHLLGNMWAQEWTNIYPLVEPYPGVSSLDVTRQLEARKWNAVRMVKLGESFFTGLGLDPLPPTFWTRSLLTKPRDRDVVCHASAWDVTYSDDLRIKMCIRPVEEDLITIHHELGHNYYQHAYVKQPFLYMNGANEAFHEAVGDTLALSVTPGYLVKAGLLDRVPPENQKALINAQMKSALEKVAFLPFAKVVDLWRWQVFAGKTTPANYESTWWSLRTKAQGVVPPVARTEADFDPGAKFHVPANVPYTRYFLARVLQFQFYRALCKAAGHEGPLNSCSFAGSKEAGRRLQAMLALGASKPWPDALEALTGERRIDAGAMLEYFAPLAGWLREQNRGRTCGW